MENLKTSAPLRREFQNQSRDFGDNVAETSDPYFKLKLLVEELLIIFTKREEKCGICVESIVNLCQHIGQTHESSSQEHDLTSTASNPSDLMRMSHYDNHLNSESSESTPNRIIGLDDISTKTNSSPATTAINTDFAEAFTNKNSSQPLPSAGNDDVNLVTNVSSSRRKSSLVKVIQMSDTPAPAQTHSDHTHGHNVSAVQNDLLPNPTDDTECQEVYSSFSHTRDGKIFPLEDSTREEYKCDTCGKFFTQSTHLRIHMWTHTGERPFKCDVCGKSFLTHSILKTHKRIHTGEKPFKCEKCGKCFTAASALVGHTKRNSCCGGMVADGDSNRKMSFLIRHSLTHRGMPLMCVTCGRSFLCTYDLDKHKLTHMHDIFRKGH